MGLCKYPVNSDVVGGIRPCGQCHHCRQTRRRQKTTRLMLEGAMHEHILFVTLTYMDEFLPTETFDPNTGQVFSHPDGVLEKRALQLFLKRLRKKFPPKTIRYFACGEYGDKNLRPHYHALLFGVDIKHSDKIIDAWCDPATGLLMCDPDRITIEEPRSHWDVAQYCNAYLTKQMTSPKDERLQGRSPEFALFSKGIGFNAVTGIVTGLNNLSGAAYIERHGDIPRNLVLNGKSMPIDRNLREKILDALQISENAQIISKEKYDEEMRAMLLRARSNPEIPKQWLSDPHDTVRIGWALEKQYVAEKSQQLLNAEHRTQLFDQRKTIL